MPQLPLLAGFALRRPVVDQGLQGMLDNLFGESSRRVVGARKVSFWARGETGNEWIEFKLGGIGWHLEMGRRFGWFPDRSIRYPDSFYKNDFLRLSNKWQKYEISVRGQNLSNVVGAFAWSATARMNAHGVIFYLDDMRYE